MSISKLKKILKTNNSEILKKELLLDRPTIVVENSFCNLVGFDSNAKELVKEALTYENQEAIYELQQLKFQIGMAYRYKQFRKIDWLKKRETELKNNLTICWLKGSTFPTGHLLLVKDVLPVDSYVVKDLRKNDAKTVNYKWNKEPLPPRYFQKKMLEIGLEYHRGVFEAAVGTGKTLTNQLLIYNLKVPALVVLPSKDLSIQTYNSFCEAFGENSVELVDSVKKVGTKKPIKICTIHTLVSLQKKKQLEIFLEGLGLICIDEVHHSGCSSFTNLLPYFNHIYYRFGFSGTFMRNDSRTLDMWGFLSTVLYQYSASQATKEGFLTPLKVHMHSLVGIRCSSYQTEYNKNYCKNQELLVGISNVIKNYTDENDQILILVGRKEDSGQIIHEYLNELGLANEYVSGDSKRDIVHKTLANFNSKKTKILIGTSVLGEGIDIKSTKHLILSYNTKSEISLVQAIGRVVRLFPDKKIANVHDFDFQGTKYLSEHTKRRLAIYKKVFDGEIVKC